MKLTDREAEFLELAAEGYDYDEIAAKCYCSRWTVKNTLIRARVKLDARNLTHAVSLAITRGLIFPEH